MRIIEDHLIFSTIFQYFDNINFENLIAETIIWFNGKFLSPIDEIGNNSVEFNFSDFPNSLHILFMFCLTRFGISMIWTRKI